METLDGTIVNTALPSMAKSLQQSPLLMQSVVIAYSLTLAILIPASGWLADRLGTRKIFFSAIILFTLGSLCCALSQTLPELICARILQGVGGSMLMPIGRLAVLRAFPGTLYIAAISFVAIPGLIGPLVGPTLGGYLVEALSWHWIFLINIPIGLIGCIVTYFAMPDSRGPQRSKFDAVGFAYLALAMVTISFALDGLSELHLAFPVVLVLFFVGVLCLKAYWSHAAKSLHPIFSLRLFSSPTFRIGIIGNLFARIGSSGMPFLIPLLLQLSLGLSPMRAGLMMIPTSVAAIFSKRIVTPLIVYWGYRKVLSVNTILVGISVASFAFFSPSHPLWLRLIQLFFFGTVNSLQFTAMNTLTLSDLAPDLTASGNSLFSMVQMLAMSFAVAAAGTLLHAFMLRYHVLAPEVSETALRAFKATFLCMGLITCTSMWIFLRLPQKAST
jgi:EmrB/QacA subfamily drug resistance transporter